MINLNAIEDSKILYEKAKAFFIPKNLPDCVIEISDGPIETWIIHFTNSNKNMNKKRHELSSINMPFIAIYADDKDSYFFYTDDSMTQLESSRSGELFMFYDETFENFELSEVKKEFLQLKNLLQKS